MSGDVQLRDYTEADRDQIFSLMEEIYDPDVMANSRGHWAWQYHENPRNPEGRVAIRVCERDGEIVAMICGVRQDFHLDGTRLSGWWVVDFMARQAGTDKKERLRYGQRLAEECRDSQPMIAGVNRPSLNRYWKRLLGDQVDICAVPMMIRPLRASKLARKKLSNPALAAAAGVAGSVALPFMYRERRRSDPEGVRFEPVTRFDDRFDAFFERVAPTFRNLAVRDAAYLNWRYLDIPDRTYEAHAAFEGDEVRGLVVTRTLIDEDLVKGRIVDLLAPHPEVEMWHYLLSRTVARFRETGADLVHGLGAVEGPIMQAYTECGFRPNPEHSRTSQYIAYTIADGVDPDVFYDGNAWYVTLGDSDTDFATPA